MRELKPIEFKESYAKPIEKKIEDFFNEVLFDYLLELVDEPLYNESSPLDGALKSGKVKYSNGLFYGKFNNKLSLELESYGAKFSKSKGGYVLENNKLPINLQQTVSRIQIRGKEQIEKAQRYLAELEQNLNWIQEKLDFADEVKTVSDGLHNQLTRTLKTVNIIPYNLTDYQVEQISQNYTNNLDKYIKGWTSDEIVKMREGFQQLVMEGATVKRMEQYILDRKDVGKRKAKFLARQETSLFVSEYQKNRLKENGVDKYKWSASMDSRTREDHKELNGKIIFWDFPPVVDKRTGDKAHAGEYFGCRCVPIPLVSDSYWSSQRDG